MNWRAVLFLLWALSACRGEPPDGVDADLPAELNARIDAVLARVEADTCFRQHPDGEGCAWGEFPYRPDAFQMAQDTGEAILVMDDFNDRLPPFAIRYKNRLRAYLQVSPEGDVVPASKAWRVPVGLYQALSAFALPEFIPAEALRPLSAPLSRAYRVVEHDSAGHGPYVLKLLLENNPHHPIVVLEFPYFQQFARQEFCDPSEAPEVQERLRLRTQHVATALRARMRELNVRFVNASNGMMLDSLRLEWPRHCEGPLPSDSVLRAKLAAYAPIYDTLFHTPGVFTAHSAIDASGPEDFPYDFPSEAFPNRLRFGFFNSLDSGLDARGQGPTAALQGWPALHNVDVYLNSGVIPRRPFPYNSTPLLALDAFGTDLAPASSVTTSWITPLGLSRFIHLRSTLAAGQELTDALITSLEEALVPTGCGELPAGRCLYQDPLLHGQVEAVRLGYRPREYLEPATGL